MTEPVPQAQAATISAATVSAPPTATSGADLRTQVTDYERQLVADSLARHQGNWAAAARELGLDRANLQRLARRLGVERLAPTGR